MKFTKMALAVVALAAAQNASAFDVYVSGASSMKQTIADMTARICNGAITQYGTGNNRLYKCTLHSSTSNPTVAAELGSTIAGQPLRLFHSMVPGGTFTNSDNLVGGSITGVLPLLPHSSNTLVKFCDDVSTNAACSALSYANPQIGFADVEPSKFTSAFGNVPTDASAIAAGWKITGGDNPANLTYQPAFIGSFGVGVTNNAIAQGVTNLSLDQLAGILSGDIYSTDQLVATASPLTIRVCRRTPGSGTQATFNALVSHKGCGMNVAGVQYAVSDAASNPQVTENAATGDVKTCLNNAQAAGEAGIGIIGLENNSVSSSYNYVSVNGVAIYDPTETLANTVDGKADNIREEKIINGSYPLWVESTVMKSAKVTLSAQQNAFYNYLAAKAGDPLFTKTYPGFLALPNARINGTNNLGEGAVNFTRGGDICNLPSWVF